ncbi:hypothetical protein HCB45_14610 [Listeria sp. FSL L7-0091]|uniref:hypothetical protein n=1 Tax=Listeria farberi TaxID=2713500 RepID=UPI001625A847|nr:hypothetical protein [Listeria farberi]MBC2262780.1 hypothetical protein [Listeria farberi]
MINLEWEELDKLELEEKVEQILDVSYNTWMLEQKNVCYFVKSFFIRWYILVDMYDVEDYKVEGENLKTMFDFRMSELENITEVDWTMGFCMGINPDYFIENDDEFDFMEKEGNELIHKLILNNPNDMFFQSLYYATLSVGKKRTKNMFVGKEPIERILFSIHKKTLTLVRFFQTILVKK